VVVAMLAERSQPIGRAGSSITEEMVVHATRLRIVDRLVLVGVQRLRVIGMHVRVAGNVRMLVFGVLWMGMTSLRAVHVKG
jgi:hypothetical protein